jgi:hypothetical protein
MVTETDITVKTSNEEKAEEDCTPFKHKDFIIWMISKIAVYIYEEHMPATFVILCFSIPEILQTMKLLLCIQRY